MLEVSDSCFLFRLVGSRFICVNHPDVTECLSDFLLSRGFSIPDYITYCIAENDTFRLKYRVYGGNITVYINPLNS